MLTPISLNQNHIGQLVIQKYSFQKYPHILYKGESVNNIEGFFLSLRYIFGKFAK